MRYDGRRSLVHLDFRGGVVVDHSISGVSPTTDSTPTLSLLSAVFDGSDDRIRFTDDAVYDNTICAASASFSIYLKCTPTAVGALSGDGIPRSPISKSHPASNNREFALYLYDEYFLVYFSSDGAGTNFRVMKASTTKAATGTEYTVFMSYDGSKAETSRVSMWINGVAQTMTSEYGGAGTINTIGNAGAKMSVASYCGPSNEYTAPFKGTINEVVFFKGLLNEIDMGRINRGRHTLRNVAA